MLLIPTGLGLHSHPMDLVFVISFTAAVVAQRESEARVTATQPPDVSTVDPQPAPPSPLRRLLPGPPGTAGPSGSTLLRHLTLAVLAGTLVVLVTNQVEPYQNLQVARVCAFLSVTAGFTVLVGLNGQLSLGHGALMATGAYTVALLQKAFDDRAVQGRWVLPLSLLLAVVVTAWPACSSGWPPPGDRRAEGGRLPMANDLSNPWIQVQEDPRPVQRRQPARRQRRVRLLDDVHVRAGAARGRQGPHPREVGRRSGEGRLQGARA